MSSKYRVIGLYDAETKKKKVRYLKKSDFETPEELEAAVAEIQLAQKLKNREFKAKKLAENIANYSKPNEDVEDILKAEGLQKLEKHVEMADKIAPHLNITIPYKNTIDLRLDPKTGNTTIIFGSSKRGKTTLMMHLYEKYYGKKNQITTLFSGNPHLKSYKSAGKNTEAELLIGYGFTPKHENYIKMQQAINVKTKNEYNFINLFDDIIEAKMSPAINKMVLTYRNANISMIMCLQYVCMLSKQNRGSINNTICFGANSQEDAEKIIDLILKGYLQEMGIKSKAEQLAFYRKATENYGFIYIDNLKNKISFHRLNL